VIPYGRQDIDRNDIEAVAGVLKSDWITQGPVIEQFEKAVADYSGSAHGVAVNSATSALHVACLALGLGPGDRLWTSPNTFVASANCALFCGAQVDFVDIDPLTCNMSVSALESRLQQAEHAGKLPNIVVPVHFAGQSCDMRAIGALAERYGFRVVEDASHAIGGKYRGEPIGNCRYSSITVFSFHPVKIITTGEGGMALTNDPAVAERMRRLRSHGITREPAMMPQEPDGPWHYQQIDLGYNFRMTDIQAALGLSQLSRLDEFVQHRHRIATNYDRLLSGLPVSLIRRDPKCYSAFHLYVIRLESGAGSGLRRKVYEHMHAAGIGVNVHYIPVHIQPYYQALGFRRGDFPAAEKYYAEALTLPLFPGLGEAGQAQVVEALQAALA
jgi:UDP-4-amino-4,6-dideoxy-N-acetyl-beta-L-altrosamine transaminase